MMDQPINVDGVVSIDMPAPKLTAQQRLTLITKMVRVNVETITTLLKNPEMKDMRVSINAISKMILTTMQMQGAFKESKEAGEIYRRKDIPTFEKFLQIGAGFILGLFTVKEFNDDHGEMIDRALWDLLQGLEGVFFAESSG